MSYSFSVCYPLSDLPYMEVKKEGKKILVSKTPRWLLLLEGQAGETWKPWNEAKLCFKFGYQVTKLSYVKCQSKEPAATSVSASDVIILK